MILRVQVGTNINLHSYISCCLAMVQVSQTKKQAVMHPPGCLRPAQPDRLQGTELGNVGGRRGIREEQTSVSREEIGRDTGRGA